MDELPTLRCSWPMPARPRPIVMIGAGGIVRDAHLPAYRKAGFPVAAIFDVDADRAQSLARKFGIERVCKTIDETLAGGDVIYDVAVPPEFEFEICSKLPRGSVVLLQKPLGVDLGDAKRICGACRSREQTAAVNFQLRFSPMMLALRDAIDRGILGEILDVEFRVNARTPWELFPFLEKCERIEMLVHSIHYIDWIRSILGEPRGVYARTVGHPDFPKLKSSKSSIILDYGNKIRCCLSINHHFAFGPKHADASASIQGTSGAAVARMGVTFNYPAGGPDTLEIATRKSPWRFVPIEGRWFPDAFAARMANLQRFAAGEDNMLISEVSDAVKTMAVVEACYTSDAIGATPIPEAV